MNKLAFFITLAMTLGAAAPAGAQSSLPGAPDASRVTAGRYQVDTDHTHVVWTVSHMGISPLSGAIAASGGTLELDPTNPAAAKVTVNFRVADMVTTVPAFTQHLLSAEIFEAEKHLAIGFTSTGVEAAGQKAKVSGNLTIKGVTRPVVIDTEFFGAGTNPMSKKLEAGFTGTARIKRSEFGLGYGLPVVTPDEVELRISAAFSRAD